MYWCCPPFLLCSSFAGAEAEIEGLVHLRELDRALATAHAMLEQGLGDDDSRGPAIRDLLEDAFWPSCQLTLEMLQAARIARFQPGNGQLQELGFACFGGPSNTKHACEDVFAHLHHVAARSQKGLLTMSKRCSCNGNALLC